MRITDKLRKWLCNWLQIDSLQTVNRHIRRVTNSNGRSEKQIIAEGIERFFRQNYELRYNILKQTEEFRPLFHVTAARENAAALEKNVTASREKKQAAGENATADRDGWQQLTDRELRRIAFEQMKEVGVAWSVDVERMLGRMLLVNIDEYNAKTEREQAKIKRVLTERDVQTRRMRSDQYLLLPRVASFVATTNDRQPLTDPTGSRRYICCEVTGVIDTSTPLDHRQVYAQAVSELRHGARWHLTKDEEARLERHNQDYRIETSPEQVLLAWYEPAPRHKDHFVRTVDILKELSSHVSKTDLPSVKLLAMALKSCGFPYGNMGGRRGWYARSRQDHT